VGGTHLSGASSEFLKRIFRILARTRPSVGVAGAARAPRGSARSVSLAHCHCGHWLAATGPRARHHCQWRPLRPPAGRASPVSPSGSGGSLPSAGAAGVAVPLLRVRAAQLALGHWQNTAPGRYPPAPRGRGTRASIRPDRNRAGLVVSFRSSTPRPCGSFVARQLQRTHSAVVLGAVGARPY
jgi:hypothetical protein